MLDKEWEQMIASRLVALSALLIVLIANPAPMVRFHQVPTSPQEDMAIFRYDWNRTGVTHVASNINTPHVRWTFNTSGLFAAGPLVLDVNKDGKMEIFVGEIKSNFDPRFLYSLDSDGHLLWTFQGKWDLGPSAIADLDRDGVPEVVFSEVSHSPQGGLSLYVANAGNGTLKWKYVDFGIWEEGFAASPVIYDVNGNGVDDLTLGSMDRYVYTFEGSNGSILWRSPVLEHYIRSSSPFVDLNGDGEKDIIAWDNHALAKVYSIRTHSLLWQQYLGYGVAMTPAVGDLDGDGRPDIVFALVVAGGVRALRADGSLLWANEKWTYFYTSPTLVDIDGDKLPDVVIGDSLKHTIVAMRGTDGKELWNTTLPNTTWSQAALVTADIDGDGSLEILAGSDVGLFSLDAKTGGIEWMFPVNKVRSEPRVVDIDGDGKAEILFGAGDGKLYVLDQMPEPRFDPRTIGYWKHQCTVTAPKGDHVGMQQSFIDAIRSQSRVFSNLTTVNDACAILWGDYKSDMSGRARQQLLALWLNVVSGLVDPAAKINLPQLTQADTVGGAIQDAENIILTHTDKPSLERAKDICDSLNNGIR